MQFSEAELILFIDALNGVKCSAQIFAGNIRAALDWDDLGSRYDVDVDDLITRLESMPLSQLTDLHSKCEEFWNTNEYSIPNTRLRLIEVGLL